MKEPVIYVRSFGGLGNRMVRYMFADLLSRKAGGLKIIGFNMPEWRLVSPEQEVPAGKSLTTGRVHNIDVDALVEQIRSGDIDWIDVNCYAMRLEYFAEARERFAGIFTSSLGEDICDDEIAISVRTGDTIDGLHADYTPIPIAYYHRIAFETGLRPVFVGQVTGNWYTDALRRQFKDARFIEGHELIDFQTLRRAKAVMVAISSFSWLAAFLSSNATQIHLPVAGLFNPKQRPDVDLLPFFDKRYHFHKFPAEKYVANSRQVAVLVSAPAWAEVRSTEAEGYMGLHSAVSQPRILSTREAATRISSAVSDSRPFCFVRLGDGEGTLLRFDPSKTTDTDLDYFRSHFGESASVEIILAIRERLRRTLDAADLIGLRDDIWLATDNIMSLNENDSDFFHRFIAEFPLRLRERHKIDEYGARRIFRLFEWAREFYPASIEACSQWVGYDLAVGGFWKDFLRARESVGLIHCSPDLPAKLSRATGVCVESFIVPDKAIQRVKWAKVLPDQPPHYPDAFLRICDRLNRPASGKVFLVGAGLAGKEYLKIIKDNGGVALDLGALLDAWDGRATRPQVYAQKTGNRWSSGDPVPSKLQL